MLDSSTFFQSAVTFPFRKSSEVSFRLISNNIDHIHQPLTHILAIEPWPISKIIKQLQGIDETVKSK
jgi:hypothetical protein